MLIETIEQNSGIDKAVNSFMANSSAYSALAISRYPGRYDPSVDTRMETAVEGLKKIAKSDYELFNELKKLSVDMLHGSISWNIEGTLTHGLIPSGLMDTLGVIALGRETISNPHLRKDVYAVTLDSAEETIRYADMRAKGDNSEAVSVDSYQSLIDSAKEMSKSGHNVFESVFRALYEDAYELKVRIDSGEIDDEVSPYPVVYGISSNLLVNKTLMPTESRVISNEIAINGIVMTESIAAVFVPEECVSMMQAEVEKHMLEWKVIALERLRSASTT